MRMQQDLPLRKDIAARFVPKIIGLMVYLGSLCFVFTLFMFFATYTWEQELTTDISIEIPTFSNQSSLELEKKALDVLKNTPGVQEAKVIPQSELMSLFHSVVGENLNPQLLSLPIIIDVAFVKGQSINLNQLKKELRAVSPHLEIINHRDWQSQVAKLIHSGVLLAFSVTCLILFAALATTMFATHTSLLIHRQIIEVLSLIGATNSYIAKQFQMNALRQGLISGTLGSLFAFLTFMGISYLFESAGLVLITDSVFFWQAICVFTLAPFFTALLMMFVARLAVMRVLRS